MYSSSRSTKLCGLIIVLFVVFILEGRVVYANKKSYVGVSPEVIEITTKQGEVIEKTFTINNHTNQTMNIEANVQDFIKSNGRWLESKEKHPRLAPMMWAEISGVPPQLEPGQSQDIKMTLKIPSDATVGEHRTYLRVRFSSDSNKLDKVSELLPVMYIKVADQNGFLNLDSSYQVLKAETNFFNSKHPKFDLAIKNIGNAHSPIRGDIKVYDVIRDKHLKIPIPLFRVLPNEQKTITLVWQGSPKFGYFKGEYQITSDGKEFQHQTFNMLILPWYMVIGILLIIVSFILFYKHYKGRQKRKAWNKYEEERLAWLQNNH